MNRQQRRKRDRDLQKHRLEVRYPQQPKTNTTVLTGMQLAKVQEDAYRAGLLVAKMALKEGFGFGEKRLDKWMDVVNDIQERALREPTLLTNPLKE